MLLAAAGSSQGPPVVVIFNVKAFATFKSVAMGAGHCDFWSHLALGYSLESACYSSPTAKPQIAVYNLGDVVNMSFSYCEDGNVIPRVPAVPGGVLQPLCAPGVQGGTFTWALAPSGTPGLMAYTLIGWPLGNLQSKMEGTF